MGTVNGQLDSWKVPAFTVFAWVAGAVALWSWRAAVGILAGLVATAGAVAVWRWRDRPAPERRPVAGETPLREVLRDPRVRRQLVVNVAVMGAFAAYWWPLALLIGDLGWGRLAALGVAAFGLVRFLAPRIIMVFAVQANADPHRAARGAFAWALLGSVILIVAGIPILPTAVAVALVAVGLLVADGTLVGGQVALRTQLDRGPDQATVNLAVELAGAIGVVVAGFATAPLSWAGSCAVGAILSMIAWFFAGGKPPRRGVRVQQGSD
jgi:predicted MFS family arabinose efflux permease